MRRLRAAAMRGATRQPTIAPRPEAIWEFPVAAGVLPRRKPVQAGIFWTAPQVPRRATEARPIATRAVIVRRLSAKISVIGLERATSCDACHLWDSGTKRRM